MSRAAACFILAAVISRCASKYVEREDYYCTLEAGHIAQNLHLMAVELGLGSVSFSAFEADELKALLRLPTGHTAMYLIPVGYCRL